MVAGTFAAVIAVRHLHQSLRGEVGSVGSYLWFAAVLGVVALAIGLPDFPQDWQPAIFSSMLAAVIGSAMGAVIQLLTTGLLPRFVMLLVPVVLVFWYLLVWRVTFRSQYKVRVTERVLCIADEKDAARLGHDAAQSFPRPEVLFTLVSAITPAEVPRGALESMVSSHDVTLLVLGTVAHTDEALLSEVEKLHGNGLRVRTLEQFYDGWFGKLALSEVSRMALFTDIGELHDPQYAYLKRLIDICLASIGVLILVFVTPFVLIGNLIANRGPLLYSQQRVGQGGKPFRILKFRTMRPDDGSDSVWTSVDDPRITSFGRLLRRLHLDELPQMVNVFEGVLSIVGPRPEQVSYVEALGQSLPHYRLRHLVKPGLTGWAQVKWRYGATEQEAWEKLQYDLYYIRHHSLTFDLKVISRTVRQMLFTGGR